MIYSKAFFLSEQSYFKPISKKSKYAVPIINTEYSEQGRILYETKTKECQTKTELKRLAKMIAFD